MCSTPGRVSSSRQMRVSLGKNVPVRQFRRFGSEPAVIARLALSIIGTACIGQKYEKDGPAAPQVPQLDIQQGYQRNR